MSVTAFYLVSAFVVLLIVLGIFLCFGKCLSLIAGYKSLPASEKKEEKARRLGKLCGIFLICVALLTEAAFLIIMKKEEATITVAFVFLALIIVGSGIVMNLANKVQNS